MTPAHLDDTTLDAAIALVVALRDRGYDRRAIVPRLRELLATGQVPTPTSRGHRTSVPYAGGDPTLYPGGTARGAYPIGVRVGRGALSAHPATAADSPLRPRRPGSLPERILVLLSAHQQGLTVPEIASALDARRDVVRNTVLKMGRDLLATGEGRDRRYLRARRGD